MAYDNNSKKFVAVINRKQAPPVIMNALAHTALGIAAKVGEDKQVLDYPNEATGFLAKISEYPFIILEAKNGSQLRGLLGIAMDTPSISYNVFTTSMIGASASDQIQSTKSAGGDELDFVAVVLFGAKEEIEPLTRKFSLFK
jgi:hypothetical protein